MKKSTKGALAAGAAAVLLLGGAGSLAYWSGSASVAGGTVSTGNVAITATDCATTAWNYTTTNHTGAVSAGLVPGDTVTKDCTVTVTGKGDHLFVALNTPTTITPTYAATPAPTTASVTVGATYTLAGAAYTSGSAIPVPSGSSQVITVHMTANYPYGGPTTAPSTTNANDTQNMTVTIGNVPITLTQVDPNTV